MMPANILQLGKKTVKRLFGIDRFDQQRVEKLYEEQDYLEAYSQHTDLRVEADPHSAIGGMWEEIGQLQFNFLLKQGLQPHHCMLDLGCGTLRGGRFFIQYLDQGNYYGTDISAGAIAYARQLVQQEGLESKNPHLLLNEAKNLKFEEFSGITFDYILAQSVFTHLKPEHIRECFEHIGQIMHDNSAFYFTYFEAEEYRQTGLKGFRHSPQLFQSLAEQYNFQLKDCSSDYPHPRGQLMVEVKKL